MALHLRLHYSPNSRMAAIGEPADGAANDATEKVLNDMIAAVKEGADHVGMTRLSFAGAQRLASVLAHNENVGIVDVSRCHLTDDVLAAFVEFLKTNRSVKTLDISNDSTYGDDGIVALATALSQNETLECIDMRFAKVGEKGMNALADALIAHPKWIDVDLRHVKIGPGGARAMARVYEARPSDGDIIYMSSSDIGDIGTIAIANALKSNIGITSVKLMNVGMGDDGATALVEMLRTNSTITLIELGANKIGKNGMDILRALGDQFDESEMRINRIRVPTTSINGAGKT